jgi:hypothetical protein
LIEAIDDIFGSLQTRVGYTPDQIRQMTLWDIFRLHRYWQTTPPLRDIVAAFTGANRPPETPSALPPEPPEFEE